MTPFNEQGKYVRIPTDLKQKRDSRFFAGLKNKRIYIPSIIALITIMILFAK